MPDTSTTLSALLKHTSVNQSIPPLRRQLATERLIHMTPEFALMLIREYPLTTPLIHLTGFPTIENFWGRTLNAWPSVKQPLELAFQVAVNALPKF